MSDGHKGQKRSGDLVDRIDRKPGVQPGRPVTEEDIQWLRQRRVGLAVPDRDPRNFVERMRDEDDERLLRRPNGGQRS